MITTRLDLLRHGTCSDGQIYRGRTDSPLSPAGEEQMGSTIQGQNWDVIYCSPLQRCHGFAQQLSAQLEIPLVADERLIELDFGDWDGQSIETVWQQY